MYSKILVALDGGAISSQVFDSALALASAMHAQLHPLYVVDSTVPVLEAPGYDPTFLIDAFREEGKNIVDDTTKQMAERGVAGTPHVVEVDLGTSIAHGILIVARDLGADLIVMGTHGRRGMRRLMLGSVAEEVLRSADVPVLMINAHTRPALLAAACAPSTAKEPS